MLSSKYINKIFIVIILLGIGFRCEHYFENASLKLDEINITVSVMRHTFGEIIRGQQADAGEHIKPPLFSTSVKVLVSLLGHNEFVLRLFPFICSILSVIAFFFFCRHFLEGPKLILCLLLFSFSAPLVHYASELNTYSSDILIVLILSLVFVHLLSKGFHVKHLFVWGLVSLIFPWFSYSSIIVTIGLWIFLFGHLWIRKDQKELVYYAAILVSWLASLKTLIQLAIIPMSQSFIFQIDKKYLYLSHSASITHSLIFIKNSLLSFIKHSLGLEFPVIVIVLGLIGAYIVFRRNQKDFLYLGLPFIIVSLFIYLELYPLASRTLLFLVPFAYIFISDATITTLTLINRKTRVLGYIVIVLVLFYPIKAVVFDLTKNTLKDNRQAMQIFKEFQRPSDSIMTSEYGFQTILVYGKILNSWKKHGIKKVTTKSGEFYWKNIWRINKRFVNFNTKKSILVGRNLTFFDTEYRHLFSLAPDVYNIPLSSADGLPKDPNARVWLFFSFYRPEIKQFVLSMFEEFTLLKRYESDTAAIYLYQMH